MIKRYRHLGRIILLTASVESNTAGAGTASTQAYTTVLKGEPGAVLTLQVTTYIFTHSGHNYTIDGVTKIINDTITRTLDGTGHVTMNQFIDVGTTLTGNAINVILTIISTTIGIVDPAAYNTNISKTT